MDENLLDVDALTSPDEFSNTASLIKSIENKIYALCVKLDVECSGKTIRKKAMISLQTSMKALLNKFQCIMIN